MKKNGHPPNGHRHGNGNGKRRGRRKGIPPALTAREKHFVALYLADPNATKAYQKAGFHSKNANVAGNLGARLLKKARVAKAVADGQARLAARWEATQDRVLEELSSIAFSDIRQIFHAETKTVSGDPVTQAEALALLERAGVSLPARGDLKNPVELDDRTAVAVQSVEVIERPGLIDKKTIEIVHKIKLHDKVGAITLLCRHLGMLHDKMEHTGNISHVDETAPDDVLLAQIEAIMAKVRARGGASA